MTVPRHINAREAPAGMPVDEQSSPSPLLATEHWSLLAARGMTWSEVMSRIAVHLTIFISRTGRAGAGHAGDRIRRRLSRPLHRTDLRQPRLGNPTVSPVHNASREDAAIILGMNRLRAGYVKMDPGIAEYLVTSRYDDQAGLMATYTMGMRRSTLSHVDGKHVNVHQHRQRDRGRHPRRRISLTRPPVTLLPPPSAASSRAPPT